MHCKYFVYWQYADYDYENARLVLSSERVAHIEYLQPSNNTPQLGLDTKTDLLMSLVGM
jgi:hypothetical protein